MEESFVIWLSLHQAHASTSRCLVWTTLLYLRFLTLSS